MSAQESPWQRLDAKAKQLHTAYGQYIPAAAFLAGICFDSLALGRIDDEQTLILQAVYLLIICFLLLLDYRFDGITPTKAWLARLWEYRAEVKHFLIGSLLSTYTVFYFKSASLWPSFVFFSLIVACLLGNEFKVIKAIGRRLRFFLFALCVISYSFYVVPIIWGRIGVGPFAVSILATLLLMAGISWLALKACGDRKMVWQDIGVPTVALTVFFVGMYALKAIPPVPLSLKSMGIYHRVERLKDGYEVTYHNPSWRFWHNGDQKFHADPGDRVYCFFSVFSPGGFQDRLQVRWFYDDPKAGWKASDAIPVTTNGGRSDGYRGFAYKQNYTPGDWQVRVETSDGREIGRIHFTVEDTGDTRPAVTEVL